MAAFGNIDQDPPADVVAAAKGLVPLILASRDEGERIRRVPPEVAKALAAAGLLQMFLPRSMGGPELAPLTVFRAIEEISKADGSIGWCAMIATAGSLVPTVLLGMPRTVQVIPLSSLTTTAWPAGLKQFEFGT